MDNKNNDNRLYSLVSLATLPWVVLFFLTILFIIFMIGITMERHLFATNTVIQYARSAAVKDESVLKDTNNVDQKIAHLIFDELSNYDQGRALNVNDVVGDDNDFTSKDSNGNALIDQKEKDRLEQCTVQFTLSRNNGCVYINRFDGSFVTTHVQFGIPIPFTGFTESLGIGENTMFIPLRIKMSFAREW